MTVTCPPTRPDLHLADELIQDGLDDADAGGCGGIGVQLDLDTVEVGGLWPWGGMMLSVKPGRNEDHCDSLVIVHLFVCGCRVGAQRSRSTSSFRSLD